MNLLPAHHSIHYTTTGTGTGTGTNAFAGTGTGTAGFRNRSTMYIHLFYQTTLFHILWTVLHRRRNRVGYGGAR